MHDRQNQTVLVQTEDVVLAEVLIRGLDRLGIDAFWATEREGRKLAQVWDVRAWIRDTRGNVPDWLRRRQGAS